MPKLFIVLILTILYTPVSAEFIGPGANNTLVAVSQIEGMRDDTRVTLVGNLVNQVAEEFYTFQDDTGKMVVQIDDDELRGLKVTPETKIRIKGDVDDDKHNSRVDVDFVEIVN